MEHATQISIFLRLPIIDVVAAWWQILDLLFTVIVKF
jgi:hypothetical protein